MEQEGNDGHGRRVAIGVGRMGGEELEGRGGTGGEIWNRRGGWNRRGDLEPMGRVEQKGTDETRINTEY